MKEIEWKVLSELMKNSRISDRELAKKIGSSQPTVTRARNKLEKEGYINEYTLIPNYSKIGYHILAFTFAKLRSPIDIEDLKRTGKKTREIFNKNAPLEIVFSCRGIGLGYQGVFVSLHKNIKSYLEFKDWLVRFSAQSFSFLDISTIEGFMISLDEDIHYRKLTFSTLAKQILTLMGKLESEEKKT